MVLGGDQSTAILFWWLLMRSSSVVWACLGGQAGFCWGLLLFGMFLGVLLAGCALLLLAGCSSSLCQSCPTFTVRK